MILLRGLTPDELKIEELKRQLERERERLDWWARRSLDHCVEYREPAVSRRHGFAWAIHVLDSDHIRASIDSRRRREIVATERARRLAASRPA